MIKQQWTRGPLFSLLCICLNGSTRRKCVSHALPAVALNTLQQVDWWTAHSQAIPLQIYPVLPRTYKHTQSSFGARLQKQSPDLSARFWPWLKPPEKELSQQRSRLKFDIDAAVRQQTCIIGKWTWRHAFIDTLNYIDTSLLYNMHYWSQNHKVSLQDH